MVQATAVAVLHVAGIVTVGVSVATPTLLLQSGVVLPGVSVSVRRLPMSGLLPSVVRLPMRGVVKHVQPVVHSRFRDRTVVVGTPDPGKTGRAFRPLAKWGRGARSI